MSGQHRAGTHPVVAGAYVQPALASKDINESLVPCRLSMTHVTHVTSKTVGVTLALPNVNLIEIVEGFIHIVQASVAAIPKGMQLIFSDLCFLFH